MLALALVVHGGREGQPQALPRVPDPLECLIIASVPSRLAGGLRLQLWRVRREADRWRVAAQVVERFDELNDNSKRLFGTPEEGPSS